MASSQSVSCTSCNVSITGASEIRKHYRSDLHLVNVKRRVSGLNALSADDFARRVQQLQAAKNEAQKGKRGVSCDVCQKRFASEKAFRNHELSRRHRDKLSAAYRDEPEWMSSVNSGDGDEDVVAEGGEHEHEDEEEEEMEDVLRRRLAAWQQCKGFGGVFDDVWFDDAQQALEQLSRSGLFVPFRERLRDVEGVVQYLSQKVCVGHACVRCERTFERVCDVRRHMHDVGHCAMTDDLEQWMLEYGEFYDWQTGDEGDGEWEEVHDEQAETAEEGDVQLVDDAPLEGEQALEGPVGALRNGDGDEEGDEVALVVGERVMGHRSLRQFYKQRVRSGAQSEAVVAARKERMVMELSRRAEGGRLPMRVRRVAERREMKMRLLVGRKNYYCRKASFKQKMVVLNSGYRA